MDLGSLELQIFVSLTVVLGGAFVALVCDYLKGNNEQLREHNIELRVRKEEQERRLLLDPAGFLGQWMPGQRQAATRTLTSAEPSAVTRAVAPHEVMQSFADPEALAEADDRAAKLQARAGDEPFETADVPPLTQRRNGRSRTNRKSSRQVRKEPENYADWVRPEVIAKVARRAQANAAYASDIREDLESLPEDALPEPLNAPESWDIRQQLPGKDRTKREQPRRSTPRTEEAPAAAQVTTTAVAVVDEPVAPQETVAAAAQIPQETPLPDHLAPEEAVFLQKEIERVAQMERRPAVAAPGTILRPLTVPSLKLEDELHRVAEISPAAAAFTWNSALLDEVIAASGAREVVAHTAVPEHVAVPLVALPELVVAAPAVAAQLIVEETVAVPVAQEELEPAEDATVVVTLEPEATIAVPLTEELIAAEGALDHIEYWEPATGSTGGGSFSDNSEPAVTLPEVPSVEYVEAQSPTLELPAEVAALPEIDFAIADGPSLAEAAVEQTESVPELVEPLALLPEPVATIASADDEPVSTADSLVEAPPVVAAVEPESIVIEAVTEETVAADVSLDHVEYWESTASALGSGSDSDTGQPEVNLPDVPPVELAEAPSPALDLPAELDLPVEVTELPAIDFTVVTLDQVDSAPELVEREEALPEPVAAVVAAADEPAPTADSLVEAPPVVVALEPEWIVPEPVTEELAADEVTLGLVEYWESAAGSTGGDSVSETGQPDTILPEVPSVVDAESQSPAFDLPAEVDELPAIDITVVTVDQVDSTPELVEPFALLPEPVATFASVDDEPVSTNDLTAVESEWVPSIASAVTEPPVEAVPVLAETEEPAFAESFLSVEMALPAQPKHVEPVISPEMSPIAAEVQSSETYVEPPPFVSLIDSAAEPVELREADQPSPVVFEVAQDSDSTEAAGVEPAAVESIVEPPPFVFELDSDLTLEPVAEVEAVAAELAPASAAEIIDCYTFWPRQSRLAGMGISPMVDYLQSLPGVETPSVRLSLVAEPALSFIETESALEPLDDASQLPDLLPAFADLAWEDSAELVPAEPEVLAAIAEPPPLWVPELQAEPERNQSLIPAAPIDISALRQPEPELVAPAAPVIPDLLLPTGMHDISTWTRLMSLPNPMTGILIVISLQPGEKGSTLPQPKGAQAPENNSPAIDKFMASFVREGDFGSHISETQWVFIYSNDVAGFNQRRVGMISEKLWDFQLRHLGLANVNFKWGAIDVKSEPLSAALEAARDRMNQTNRARKLPGADRVAPRRVVNG